MNQLQMRKLKVKYGQNQIKQIEVNGQQNIKILYELIGQQFNKSADSLQLMLSGEELDEDKLISQLIMRDNEFIEVIDKLEITIKFDDVNKQFKITLPQNFKLMDLDPELNQMVNFQNKMVEYYKGQQKLNSQLQLIQLKIQTGDVLSAKFVEKQQNILTLQFLFRGQQNQLNLNENETVERLLDQVSQNSQSNRNYLKLFQNKQEIDQNVLLRNLQSLNQLEVDEVFTITLNLPAQNKSFKPLVRSQQLVSEIINQYQNYFSNAFQIDAYSNGKIVDRKKSFTSLGIKENSILSLQQIFDGGQ